MRSDVRRKEAQQPQIDDLLELREQTIGLQKEAMDVFGNLYRQINEQIIQQLNQSSSERYNGSHKVVKMD